MSVCREWRVFLLGRVSYCDDDFVRKFPHTYIPVVPASIIECVEAPTPFVMGVHSSCRDKVRLLI